GEARQPIPAAPGQLERYDYEYRRNGTVNLFVVLDVHRPWRKVRLTERRTARDYAQCLRDLVDIDFPDADKIRVVQDNLSTHSPGALYQAFPPAEARRILRRLEFHYVPKHASWLNMVEIEIGVLRGQCLDRRIDDPKRLASRHADDFVRRKLRGFLQRPNHRIERIGDADDKGARRIVFDAGADRFHDLEVDAEQIVAAHPGLARYSGRDDDNVGASDR